MSAISALNTWAFHVVLGIASTPLNVAMQYLAESFLVVLPVVALYMYFRKDRNVFSFVAAIVIFYIVGDIIKMIVREPRPCNVADLSWINHIGCEASFSFPSNHATVLTGLYAFVGKYKYIRIAYVAWMLLVLFGRVYLGAHYLTDVIAGILLSIFLAYFVYRYRNRINGILLGIFCKLLKPLCHREWRGGS